MPLLANVSSPSSPHRFTRTRRWLWTPLLLALTAPVTLAEPAPGDQAATPEPAFAVEAARAESSGEVVRVAPEHQTHLSVRGAERVRVDAPEVLDASLGEPNQVMVHGLRPGRSQLLVWRKGSRPLLLRVEVAR